MEEAPVIAFLIPLRPKKSDSEWKLASKLLQQTCDSLINQSDRRFVAIIAGHDEPCFLQDYCDGRVRFVKVDFGLNISQESSRRDKFWKVCYAGMCASEFDPLFHMILDADDLIHQNLVHEVFLHKQVEAIILNQGWEADLNFSRALKRQDLHHRCGSTFILRRDRFPLPQGRGWDEWNKMPHLKVPHQDMETWLIDKQIRNCCLDFPAIFYIKGHSINLSNSYKVNYLKRWLGFHILGQTINQRLCKDYGIKSFQF